MRVASKSAKKKKPGVRELERDYRRKFKAALKACDKWLEARKHG